MSSQPLPLQHAAQTPQVSEKYLIAFVIQGDDVFRITADNIIHTTGTADGPAFDAIAKLKAAAALLELTNRHKERPDELRKMARELAGEGMKLMARASSGMQPMPNSVSAAGPEFPEAEFGAESAATQATAAAAERGPDAATASRVQSAPPPHPEEAKSDTNPPLDSSSPSFGNSRISLISS